MQNADIVLVPGVIDAALNAEETAQINPVGAGFVVFPTDAPFPGRSESGALDHAQEVHAIGGNAKLQNLFVVIRIEKKGTSKFGKCTIRPLHIAFVGINPQVHILRVARFCVIDESKAADDKVPDAVLGEKIQQVFKILNALHRS